MLPVKLLLAEDDEDDRYLFETFLKDRKDVIFLPPAENGVELLFYLDSISPNLFPQLIILDQNMPKMKGKETLEKLKTDPKYMHIPVVIYSTYTDKDLINECMKAGALLVLTKPFTENGYHWMIDEIFHEMRS